jgi:7-keto-8-aminopelargonate synthetase-like enzyme
MSKRSDFLRAVGGSALDYFKISGKSLHQRFSPIYDYGSIRDDYGVYFSANRVLTSLVSTYVDAEVANHPGERYLNFSSQDYLGLSQNDEVKNAARIAIDEYGIHTASSPILTGRNKLTEKLEETLAGILGMEQCLLYPTGWGACFGAIAALVTGNDQLILDSLSHNSLQTAAKYSVECAQKFKHNDINHLESLLKKSRSKNPEGAIFVVVESLYSMNSDIPDLANILDLTMKYEAILILDIAHDFGAMGEKGLGILETVRNKNLDNVVVCGAFSKSFASNGGFVAGPEVIRRQLIVFSPTYTFSNGISPMQCAVAQKCAEIIFSEQGTILRKKLKKNINDAIGEFKNYRFVTIGVPSPIVPVLIGPEDLTRLMAREMTNKGVLANMAEFPAVPKGKSIFRFQMMSNHRKEHIVEAARTLAATRTEAEGMLRELKK